MLFNDKNDGPSLLAYFQESFIDSNPEPPKSLNQEELLLIEKIQNAFQGVQLEDGIGLMQAEAIDDYACDEIQSFLAKYDERTDWSKLTERHLNTCSCALSYLDPKGFKFLIPAFVIHDIRDQLRATEPYHSLTYSSFSYSPESDNKDYLIYQCSLLTEKQKSTLQEYIQYCRTYCNYSYSPSLWDPYE